MKRKPLILTAQIIILAILGCTSVPFLAPPTETPTPTATATATLTPTITPTSTPTLTPTPIPLVVIEELSSGEFLYRNRRIGIELTFPDNWIILDLVEGEADGTIEETLEEYPDLEESIQSAIEQMGARDAELIAFPAFDQEKGSRLSSFFTMMPQDNPGGGTETPMEEVIEFFGNFITELLNGIEVQEQEVIISNSGRDIGKILFAWDLATMFDSDAFGELFASPDSDSEEVDFPAEALLLQYNFVEIDDYLLLFVSTAPSSNLESFEDVDDIIKTIETIEVDIQSQ